MNNKGMSIVELVVSFSLTVIIGLFLIEVVLFLKNVYAKNGVKADIVIHQALVSDQINKQLLDNRIVNVDFCGNNCVNITLDNSKQFQINLNKDSNKVVIGDYVINMPSSTVIGDLVAKTSRIELNNGNYNSIFQIYVPITSSMLNNQSFDINIIYQYDSNKEPFYFANVFEYAYTGNYQTFIAPIDGFYQIELFGAQGGSATYVKTFNGGNGAYSSGKIYLKKDELLYVYVGGMGESISGTTEFITTYNGYGYNGGTIGFKAASNSTAGGGGGATDIRYNGQSLNDRIMVAGGGGGGVSHKSADSYSGSGGSGGTLIGNNGSPANQTCYAYGSGGTQIIGGKTINCTGNTENYSSYSGTFGTGHHSHAGGGGGYYGGGSGVHAPAGGGSSFISGYAGVNAITSFSDLTPSNNTLHYSNKYFIDGYMEAGVNSGNGKAKITLIATPKRTNTKLNNVVYIKDCINNTNEKHWVEIQAINQGINVAHNKTVLGTFSQFNDTNYAFKNIVDGNISNITGISGYGYMGNNSLNQCITVDLENEYDLDEVAVWHYWSDSRTYNNNITYVSSDGENWIPIISKSLSESSNGKRVNAYTK